MNMTVLNDFWFFLVINETHGRWEQIESTTKFQKYGHSMSAVGKGLFVQGGTPWEENIVRFYNISSGKGWKEIFSKLRFLFSADAVIRLNLTNAENETNMEIETDFSFWLTYGGIAKFLSAGYIVDKISVQKMPETERNRLSPFFSSQTTNLALNGPNGLNGRYETKVILNGNNLFVYGGRNEMFVDGDVWRLSLNFGNISGSVNNKYIGVISSSMVKLDNNGFLVL